ncbi:hypothetical protein CACET_c34050 [Clostridium aceticum]|uniref:Uncharacterized protein n=1 Tax=Clostridium aceticum TaxID=84022 RepID=A0A0G3WEP5_9CLOT|nr:hypothetical protein [Clostridium aceticum]AKL96848.1 hypothetical protein CACET_c34050 [Clostridium aceticum]
MYFEEIAVLLIFISLCAGGHFLIKRANKDWKKQIAKDFLSILTDEEN